MCGRVNDVKSYIELFQIDEPLDGAAVGTGTEFRSSKFKADDTVRHFAE